MDQEMNELGQPVGFPVPGWKAPPFPNGQAMKGRMCRLERLDPGRHAAALYQANAPEQSGKMWTYLAYGPFETFEAYRQWMAGACAGGDTVFYAIIDAGTGQAAGVAAYLRIDRANGCIEVGHLAYSPPLQRTAAATEAMYLMMNHAFELGYRRYEWKCHTLNAPSRAAALRLGFRFEGIFRQAVVTKGRNRDTAWFSIIDRDWPAVKAAFGKWLSSSNFDSQGRQKKPLREFMPQS